MNSRIVVGVGHIYASEALFRAGIAPMTPAGRLGAGRCEKLVQAIKITLDLAIEAGGSSLRAVISVLFMMYVQARFNRVDAISEHLGVW